VRALARPAPFATFRAPATGFKGQVARLDDPRTIEVSAPEAGPAQGRRRRFEAAIANLRWRPGRNALLVTTTDPAHRQTLWLWELASNRLRLLARANGVLNDGAGYSAAPCALAARRAVCVAAGPVDPPHLVDIDLDTGEQRLLDRPPAPDPGPDRIEARTLIWTDAKGRRFGGVLMLPMRRPGHQPLPLVLTYYECAGFVRGGVGDEWPMAALAARGVASLCIDQTADVADPLDSASAYQAGLSGVRAIVEALGKAGLVDSRRVGMGGLSFGSEVTLWIAAHSDLLAAASIASGEIEPIYYWYTALSGQHPLLLKAWGLGDPDLTRPAWERMSSALHAQDIRTPLLMQLPEQEFRYNMELYAKLSDAAVPVDMYAFPNEPHVLTQPEHRLAAYQRNLDWFLFWLKSEEDPLASKAEQYRRWRAQRQAWAASPAHATPQPRSQSSTSANSNSR
ncbi:MAG: prolyl oligopeptidase family serine peptidase, partial [Caulobacteraceae bacterium]